MTMARMRMVNNYAALLCGWDLLTEFADMPSSWNRLPQDLIAEMNSHTRETGADRQPWVWITEIALSEIAAGEFRHPYKWCQEIDPTTGQMEDVLCIRPAHIMDHISNKPALRDKWNGLPVKSDRVYKKQLDGGGVILKDTVERTINHKRVGNMVALSLSRMEQYALYATPFNGAPDSPST